MTILEICNHALIRIGHSTITEIGLDADTAAGRYCHYLFPQTVEQLLSKYHWAFATRRSTLAKVEGERTKEYPFIYILPADCLLVLRVLQSKCYKILAFPDYLIVGKRLESIHNSIDVVYTSDMTKVVSSEITYEVEAFPPHFMETFILFLALKLCTTIREEPKMYQTVYQEWTLALNQAQKVEAGLRGVEFMDIKNDISDARAGRL
jgi:hypothetical protein